MHAFVFLCVSVCLCMLLVYSSTVCTSARVLLCPSIRDWEQLCCRVVGHFSLSLPLVLRSPREPNFRRSDSMWVYQGNGDVHLQGSALQTVNPPLNTGDTVRCVVDMETGSMSCTVNGAEYLVCSWLGVK
jgi:hypothetical protein